MMFLTLCLLGEVAGYAVDDIQGKVIIKDSFPTTMENIEFGSGFNSITLKRTYNTAVDVDRTALPRGGFIEINFKIKLCKSREEFFQSFSGGISASGSYMGVEGSASVKFLTETKITSLDSVLIASVDAITDTQISTNARFNELSKKMLASGDYVGFTEKYGTHYLRQVILGGKMMLVMKFSSTSKEVKRELDSKLSVSTGTFGAEAEFAAKMKDIREKSSLEISLYAAGGNVAPPKPSVEEGIDYAVEFAKSILDHPAVREVEFAASWTIPGAPSGFKSYIFPEQAKTDALVHIAVGLLNAQSQLEDMKAMRRSEMAYISESGWRTIKELESKALQSRLGLQTQFSIHSSAGFQAIINEYKGRDEEVKSSLSQLLADEQKYDCTKKMYLKSAGTGLFVSTNDGSWPRLDRSGPIPLWMKDIRGNKNVFYGGTNYVMIGSETQSGSFICMVGGKWYAKWVNKSDADTGCHWRLAHSTEYNKKTLEFGDRVILFNRKWTDYIFGVSDDGKWVEDRKAGDSSDRRNQWIVDKTQF